MSHNEDCIMRASSQVAPILSLRTFHCAIVISEGKGGCLPLSSGEDFS